MTRGEGCTKLRKANLATSLPRKARGNQMHAYDALPRDVRCWLASACLPWSPQSVARLWHHALREANGDMNRATARLDAAERKLLERDAPKIWGKGYSLAQMCHLAQAKSGSA